MDKLLFSTCAVNVLVFSGSEPNLKTMHLPFFNHALVQQAITLFEFYGWRSTNNTHI